MEPSSLGLDGLFRAIVGNARHRSIPLGGRGPWSTEWFSRRVGGFRFYSLRKIPTTLPMI